MIKKKRKGVKAREANGRPQRQRYESPGEIRRLRDAALSGMRDPEWGTELGRLFLVGKVSPEEYAAGKRWSAMAAEYRSAMLCPRGMGALQLERGSQGQPVDPDTGDGQAEAERHKRAVAAYLSADADLRIHRGAVVLRAVQRVCEENSAIDYQQLLHLKDGLAVMASRWNLTGASKSPNVR